MSLSRVRRMEFTRKQANDNDTAESASYSHNIHYEESKKEEDDFEGNDLPVLLLNKKKEIETEQKSISQQFKKFYGIQEGTNLFNAVVQSPSNYYDDEREIFRDLAQLSDAHKHIQKEIQKEQRKHKYSRLQPQQMVDKLVQLEQKVHELYKTTRMKNGRRSWLVYLFGGKVNNGSTAIARSTARMFETNSRAWTELPDMPTARWSPVTVTHQQKIYIIGGFMQAEILSLACEEFDCISQRWTCLPHLPCAMDEIEGSSLNQDVLVWGRKDNLITIFRLDTGTNIWHTIPSPPSCAQDENEKILLIPHSCTLFSIRTRVGHPTTCYTYHISKDSVTWQLNPYCALARSIDMAQINLPPFGFKTYSYLAVIVAQKRFLPPALRHLCFGITNNGLRCEDKTNRFTIEETREAVSKCKEYLSIQPYITHIGSYKDGCGRIMNIINQDKWSFHISQEKENHDLFVFDGNSGSWSILKVVDDTEECTLLDFHDGVALLSDKCGMKLFLMKKQMCIPLPLADGDLFLSQTAASLVGENEQEEYTSFDDEMPM